VKNPESSGEANPENSSKASMPFAFNSPLAEGCREAAECSAVLPFKLCRLFQTASFRVRFLQQNRSSF